MSIYDAAILHCAIDEESANALTSLSFELLRLDPKASPRAAVRGAALQPSQCRETRSAGRRNHETFDDSQRMKTVRPAA
jgi:hypothetical protein